MDLDILLPFHRVDKYLVAAINSLNLSKGVSFRIIMIDDRIEKNQDLTPILRGVKNLSLINTSGGVGYGLSLELGSTVIESDVVALFNSDDLVSEDRFYKQTKALNKSEVSITNMQRILENGKSSLSKSGSIKIDEYSSLFLLFGSYGANATWCVRKDWWKDNVFFDQLESLDWRIALRAFRKSKIDFSSELLYFYRKHNRQSSLEQNELNTMFPNVYDYWKDLSEFYGLIDGTKQVFDFFATPWLPVKKSDPECIFQWVRDVDKITQKMNPKIRKQIDYFIERRFLVRTLNSKNDPIDRVKFFKRSKFGLNSFVSEFTSLAFNRAFRA